MSAKDNNKLIVKCPKCEKSFEYYSSNTRPFCSDRCSKVDLGNWFNEVYATPQKGPLKSDEIEELERVLEERHK